MTTRQELRSKIRAARLHVAMLEQELSIVRTHNAWRQEHGYTSEVTLLDDAALLRMAVKLALVQVPS
jgi:hypothetical protein